MREDESDEVYRDLERRALFELPAEEETTEELDVVDTLRGGNGGATAEDLTLAGYVKKHNRPPAFEGVDGQAYTVDVDTEATSEPGRPFAAFFVFIRWAETGAGIM